MNVPRLFLALAAIFLTACDPASTAGSGYDAFTHINHHSSENEVIFRSYTAEMDVQAVILDNGVIQRYALLTGVRRSGPNFPFIEDVYQDGHRLNYEKYDRRRANCIDGCDREEVGAIHLSRAQFMRAAVDGLTFKMIGRRGSYEGTASAALFSDVITLVDTY